uniref:Uncharacterized protein n=1 Tax=Ditylum brightwellii TaxID=49249 RepID=A0A7S4R4K0_9STRA|mmetsp:Transcript_35400/g.53565  ORF Transcript_35400/g.53565 Transcript_35400/m.53565 type:complete len:205 (-) Transcript_35400:557-1171(-)
MIRTKALSLLVSAVMSMLGISSAFVHPLPNTFMNTAAKKSHSTKRNQFTLLESSRRRNNDDDDDDDDEDDDRELVYARRSNRRRGFESEKEDEYEYEVIDDDDDDHADAYDDILDFDADEFLKQEKNKKYSDIDEEYDGIIPNPLLDVIDPEGAIDRIIEDEVWKDPEFIRDVALVVFIVVFFGAVPDFNVMFAPIFGGGSKLL